MSLESYLLFIFTVHYYNKQIVFHLNQMLLNNKKQFNLTWF